MTLNLARWVLALLPLAVFGGWVLKRGGMWPHWRRFALLGLLGISAYSSLQYLALHTSTPLNVTLVASALPLFMLVVGRLFFGATIKGRQVAGALLSMAGVTIVLARGDLANLRDVHFVRGDLFILGASLTWAFYSWTLQQRAEPERIRADWAAYLLAQAVFGVLWSAVFSVTEWATGFGNWEWSPRLGLIVVFLALGPAVVAYTSFSKGVELAGPAIAGFFVNLVPVFVAVLSALTLGEVPQIYHVLAFALIIAGIVVSSRTSQAAPGTAEVAD